MWSPTFQDRHVLSDKEILDAASWLVRHPLRRGLADRLTDYPFWDAVWI